MTLTDQLWNQVFNPWWDRSTWGDKVWLAVIG